MRKVGWFVWLTLILSIAFTLWLSTSAIFENHNLLQHFHLSQHVEGSSCIQNCQFEPKSNRKMHLLFGLSENHTGLMMEFEVALKSVLLNAPLDFPLDVHIIADQSAIESLELLLQERNIGTWKTRQPISIHIYNVEHIKKRWINQLRRDIPQRRPKRLFEMHTIGTWFRLFAHEILPANVQYVLYMDVDVVIMANLQNVWSHLQPSKLFQWGQHQCAGFLLINIPRLKEVWQLFRNSDMKDVSNKLEDIGKGNDLDDQLIFRMVTFTHPEKVGLLPPEWDLSLGNDIWKFGDTIVEKRSKAGMLHYNGGANSKEAYFANGQGQINVAKWQHSWGINNYYVRLPWTWACFIAESQASEAPFPLTISHHLV